MGGILTRVCQPVSFSSVSHNVKDTDRNIGFSSPPETHLPERFGSSRPCLSCQCRTGAVDLLWDSCFFLFLFNSQFHSLSCVPQVLRPGSRYEVSVTGVRTGNESGSISTEFTTGELEQKTHLGKMGGVCGDIYTGEGGQTQTTVHGPSCVQNHSCVPVALPDKCS